MRLLSIRTAVLALVSLAGLATEASSQVVPHKGKGTGVYTPGNGDYGGPGVATHLGKFTYTGNVVTSPTADPLVFDFQSTVPQQTVAANGDTIQFSFSGQVQLVPLDATFTTFTAVWTGEFVVLGGTGRFANVRPADQPIQVVAVNDPFTFSDPQWTFRWTLDGEFVLR